VSRPDGRRRRARRLALVLALALVVVVVPAGAQELDVTTAQDLDAPAAGADPGAPPAVRLTVTSLTGILGPGTVPVDPFEEPDDVEPPTPPPSADDLEVRVVVENLDADPVDGLRLVIEVHPAVASRTALRAALEDGPLGGPTHVHDLPLGTDGTLGPQESTVASDAFTGATMDWPATAGVHPVRFALVRGTTVLATVTSAVVWLPEAPADPTPFTLLLRFDEAPWRTSGGAYPEGVDRSIEVGGRLDTLLRALERHPDAGVTLSPAAHLVEDLVDRADGFVALERLESGNLESREEPPTGPAAALAATTLERLRAVAAALPYEPVSGPYAAADLTALQAGEAPLPDLAAQAAVDGRRRAQRALGRSVDAATTVLSDPVEPAVLDLLPGEVVVLPYAATARPDPALEPALAPTVAPLVGPTGRRLLAVVGDPYLDDLLTDPDAAAGPVLAAQRVLAETAMVHLAAPGSSERAIAAIPAADWRPDPRFLDVLLTGVVQAPWLQPLPPSQLALTATTGTVPLELRGPGRARFPAELGSALAAAARDLDAAHNALPPERRLIDGREPAELRDQLLRATSGWLSNGAVGEAESLVRDVQRAVDASFGDVEVAASSVTLTSDAGPVPITVRRTRGGPLVVQVEILSQGRLRFPEGRTSEPILLEEDGTETVAFPVTAVTTGSFPLTVRVTDPTGGRELARTVVPVRSTAVSGPALAGIGLVVLALLLVGARRRPGRPPPAPGLRIVREGHDPATPAGVGSAADSRSVAAPRTVPTSDGSS
jgi:hypothetical protein